MSNRRIVLPPPTSEMEVEIIVVSLKQGPIGVRAPLSEKRGEGG